MQGADVQEIGALHPRELRLGLGVQLRLEPAQGLDHGQRSLDRMRALVRGGGVPRSALDRDPRPDDPHGDEIDVAVRRLGDDDAVRRGPGEAGREGAVPAALLLDHALVDDAARQGPRRERGLDREQHGRNAALHVARASPIQAAALDHRAEGGPRPEVGRLLADDVHVPVEEERPPIPARQGPDQTATVSVGGERNTALRVLRELSRVGLERPHGKPEVTQAILDQSLRALLRAEDAGDPARGAAGSRACPGAQPRRRDAGMRTLSPRNAEPSVPQLGAHGVVRSSRTVMRPTLWLHGTAG